jgi:hypothetical protein
MSLVTWVDSLPIGRKSFAGILGASIAAVVGVFGLVSNPGPDDCEKAPLRHVYKPSRLEVVATCQKITVTVRGWRHEHDNDYHVNVDVDGGGWVNDMNVRDQHGQTVIEWVPGDPKPHDFHAGQRLEIVTTKVYDTYHKRKTAAHGWIEGHPVFSVRELDARTPAKGGSVPNATDPE